KHSDNAKRVGCHVDLRNHHEVGRSHITGNALYEPFQIERPALIALDSVTHAFPALAMAFKVTVLKLQPSPAWRLSNESQPPFTCLVGIAFDLPARADVPA